MMINKILPEGSKRKQLAKNLFIEPKIPAHLARNFRPLNTSETIFIQTSLEQNYFSQEPTGYLSTEVGKKDLLDHLTARLESNRRNAIPWMDSVKKLHGAQVLEIGCGTGASTVALAEQGASVIAVDINEKALIDAQKRCEIYGLNVAFHNMNSTEVAQAFSDKTFDFIIFWACLEHMTHEERMIAMQETWDMLPSGGLWCVAETPNRLYYYDTHTSLMPFYLWLPDDLAIKYAHFSPRRKFRENFMEYDSDRKDMLDLARWGRGVSFHEFELTIAPLEKMNIVSCMSLFLRRRGLVPFFMSRISTAHRYESFFHRLCPSVHRGFLQEYLDLIIQKD